MPLGTLISPLNCINATGNDKAADADIESTPLGKDTGVNESATVSSRITIYAGAPRINPDEAHTGRVAHLGANEICTSIVPFFSRFLRYQVNYSD